MKHIICLFLSAIIVCSVCVCASAASSQANPSTYTDETYGLSFTLPKNWRQVDEDLESGILAKFESTKQEGIILEYSVTDIFDNAYYDIPKSSPREEINNDFFSEGKLTEMLSNADYKYLNESKKSDMDLAGVNLDLENCKKIKYKKTEFFVVECKITRYGTEQAKITYAISVKSGYLYTLLFTATPKDKCYADFEKVLDSCTIDKARLNAKIKSTNNAYYSLALTSVIGAVIAVGLMALGIVFYNKLKPIYIEPYSTLHGDAPPATIALDNEEKNLLKESRTDEKTDNLS